MSVTSTRRERRAFMDLGYEAITPHGCIASTTSFVFSRSSLLGCSKGFVRYLCFFYFRIKVELFDLSLAGHPWTRHGR
jgi:hypothetical protein